ncbi:MAG: HD-GYP domain-containing protein [Firmicutes bacterium]|nr:HD-GYP domain-containing protein [Bacillota bacterium]
MRPVDLSDLQEGMRLAKAIYAPDGRLLLGKGVKLTPAVIQRLRQLEVLVVYIEDEYIGTLEVEEVISESLQQQSIRIIKECAEKIRGNQKLNIKLVTDIVNQILDDIGSSPTLVVLNDIRTKSTHLYNHSVSVCVLAILTGIAMGYDQLRLKLLGTGALLHDIGKGTLDEAILNNSNERSASEEAVYREHPTAGFELIRTYGELSLLVAHTAFQHHERFDGSGYPRGLKGEEIHPFGKITAVADTFDNLVSPLNPAKRLYPHQALQQMVAEAGKAFDPQILKVFCKVIAPYPVGSTVQLSTGDIGVVVHVDPEHPARPKVKLISNKFGIIIHKFPVVDLKTRPQIFIQDVLTEKQRPRLKVNNCN